MPLLETIYACGINPALRDAFRRSVHLRREMMAASSFHQWWERRVLLDEHEGRLKWKQAEVSAHFDYKLVRHAAPAKKALSSAQLSSALPSLCPHQADAL